MQHELESLRNRISVLEDAELEVMERQEAADAALATATTDHEQVSNDLAAARESLTKQVAALHEDVAAEQTQRQQAAGGLPEALLTLYDRVRDKSHGVGAARLYQGRCEGCNMQMTTADLQRIRAAPLDEVIRCEECSRILVRTGESGL